MEQMQNICRGSVGPLERTEGSAAMKTPLLYIDMESKCHMEFSCVVVHSLIAMLSDGLDMDAVELPIKVHLKCRRIMI